ncbi:putative Ig domain-containing protein [Marinigracilibium pacificum]|uniref:Tandem-95 repeat protein n=1 Tax=Marinigracilibium pacificum TaxID=2729599 RepID=A0A848IY57_9BACT|nr:putative Ig domain-containing protein [Marinigracilibium pacificum]NMM47220.1 tandem-95 repeat protein [Marinigracilibium pacificum]
MKRFFLTGKLFLLATLLFGNSIDKSTDGNSMYNPLFYGADIQPVDDQMIAEGDSYSYIFDIEDDVDDIDDLDISFIGLPQGAVFDKNTLTLSWVPGEDQGGLSYYIDLIVVDTDMYLSSESFVLSVSESNQAPQLTLPTLSSSYNELSSISFTASATDSDLPANQLTYSLSGDVPSGASIDPLTGEFDWVPTEEQGPMTYTFFIVVTDNHGGEDQEEVTVSIEEDNINPVLDPVTGGDFIELSLISIDLNALDSDLPQQNLTYSFSGLTSSFASIDPASGVFNWTPSEAEGPGVYNITFVVTDSYGGQNSIVVQFNILEKNEDPEIEKIEDQQINESQLWTYQVIATDEDIEDGENQVLSYDFKGMFPDGMTIDENTGLISWVPSEIQGPGDYEVTVRVRDDGSPRGSDEEKFKIKVLETNRAPLISDPGEKTVNELALLEFTLTATDPDIPVNSLKYAIVSGAASGMSLDSNTGRFTWTPSENQGPSVYNVRFSVSDGQLPSEIDVRINVNEVNSLPVIGTLVDRNINEEELLSFTVTASDSDLPQNTLKFYLQGNPPSGASINETTGEFRWTPSEQQGPGVYAITVEVNDGLGSSTKSFNINVREVNKTPVFTSGAITEAQENVEYVYNIVAEDPDNGDNVTLSVPTKPSWLTFTQTGNGTGTLRGTPSGNDVSDNDVVIRATDKVGATATQSYFISFELVNDPPEIISSPVTQVQEGLQYVYNIIATDPDPNDQLTITTVSKPTWITLTNNGNGRATLSGTPQQNDVGSHQVSIKVTDAEGLSDTQSFSIVVQDDPDNPILSSATFQVDEDDTLYLNSDVFDQYYSDPDNDPLATVRVVAIPSNGQLFIDENPVQGGQIVAADQLDKFIYVPNTDFIGSDSIRLRVSDGAETAVNATWWRINVIPVNDKPVVLNFNDFDFFYNEFEDLQPIIEFGEIVDDDSENMAFLEAYFLTSFENDDYLTANVDGTILTANYDEINGKLRIEGSAPKSVYEDVMNTLSFGYAGESSPRPFPRGIGFVVSDGVNLSDVYSRIMTFENASVRLDIVDAFTPNGDGVNDTWSILNTEFFDEVIVRVFDVEGQMVFFSDGYQDEWDGSFEGSELLSGTYYYVIDLGRGRKQKGSVTILK